MADAVTRRLLKELRDFQKEPNPDLVELAPTQDDDILVWRATGEICLDILKSAWSPAWTLQSACMAIRLLLSTPEPNSPLNCDAANLIRCGDKMGYDSLVRMYTQIYAMDPRIENGESLS
ncbi:4603_t:CDS:2 [Ambispora leptoticha]|uniref:4603_t:CDS:1 n=1 Tax=Ambispora leptoticha TaxID=144679 RepID=A0A9N9HXV7_9GLOM|nr:4603_t:CDS:2 [Ambispora leptoticha]